MKTLAYAIGGASLVYLAFSFIFLSLNPAAWGEVGTRAICVIYMAGAAGLIYIWAAMFSKDTK